MKHTLHNLNHDKLQLYYFLNLYFTTSLLNVYTILNVWHSRTYQMSTFSDTGSFLITSGAIQATVPANDIFVLLSLSSLDVPKSEIFTVSLWVTKTLRETRTESMSTCQQGFHKFYNNLIKTSMLTISRFFRPILSKQDDLG